MMLSAARKIRHGDKDTQTAGARATKIISPICPRTTLVGRLQEALAELFATIVAPKHHSLGVGIWHSLVNDRAQRDMLAAANSALEKKLGTKAAKDIKWLLDKVTSLADQRNTAIHSPLVFVVNPGGEQPLLMPLFFLGNPRAAKLRDKDLLNEFTWYRARASALASFADRVRIAISVPEHFAWPDRPELPALTQRKKPKRRSKG